MPTGVYQSKNRKGGQKGRSGVYIKTQEHKDKIRATLKEKGIKPPFFPKGVNHPLHGKKKIFKNLEETKRRMSLSAMGKTVSAETRKKMSEQRKGEKHWHWKKDRSLIVTSEKKHLDGRYKNWMSSVKKRDCWKCKINNSDCEGRLESHHILDWKNYPELRYDINNGITLCHAHHPRGREDEVKLSSYFKKLVAEMN